ncbi:MAG: alpha/beta hydrolase [Bdellovibrionales bacterium]|nr:alpha/beta hydrolase [Bdellovibrionales bacterium]
MLSGARLLDDIDDPFPLSTELLPQRPGLATLPNRTEEGPHIVERFRSPLGHYRVHRKIWSEALDCERQITVFLPHEYKLARESRFPVLYMQDGQNLFEGAPSTRSRGTWGIDRSCARLFAHRHATPTIIVGIDNDPDNRADDYAPEFDPNHRCGGARASAYSQFVSGEVKPLIDDLYRTDSDRLHTSIGGSSLGALAALNIALEHPNSFGNVLAMSPTFWWGNFVMADRYRDIQWRDTRFVIDFSSHESEAMQRGGWDFARQLQHSGWRHGEDLHVSQYIPRLPVEEHGHNEPSWGLRFANLFKLLQRV